MKERIKEFIEYKGISAGELAALLEVQRSNISHILNGRNKPGALLIEKMLLVFSDLNARWLLTGDGNMIDNNETSANVQEATTNTSTNNTNVIDNKLPKQKTFFSEDSKVAVGKQINKVVLLYKDGTFDSYDK